MQIANQRQSLGKKRRIGFQAGAEQDLFAARLAPDVVERDGWIAGSSQALNHEAIGNADAFVRIEIPVEIDAEGREDLLPAIVMDGLGVGEDAIEVEKDGIPGTKRAVSHAIILS